jgi:hypothetical protein
MRKNLQLLLILFLIFSSADVFSQKAKAKKKDNRKSDTKEVQVFGEENEDYFSDQKGVASYNIIKINPLVAIVGDFPIYYERVLNKHFALEVSAGATLRPRFALSLNDLSEESDYTNLDPRIGYMGGADLKYYPSRNDDAPDGFYMSIGTRYKKYQALSYGFDEIGVPLTGLPTIKTPLTVTDLVRVSAGSGNIYDNFFSEYFFGFSLRKRVNSVAFPIADPNTGLVSTQLSNTRRLVPAFFVGVKIGFSF